MAAVHTLEGAAERAGVEPSYLSRLRELGIVPGDRDGFSDGDVRRALTAKSLEGAGIPLDVLGAAMQGGRPEPQLPRQRRVRTVRRPVQRDVPPGERADGGPARAAHGHPGVDRDGPALARRSDARGRARGLAVPRDADRRGVPHAGDRAAASGTGDATRRISEQEAAWWRSEVIEPAMAAGKSADEIGNPEFADQITAAVGAGHALHVPRTASARVDRQHHRGLRDS